MLEVKNIETCYEKIQVIWGISFQVKEGEIVLIIGANGSGKSTVLRTISGILRPKSGDIYFKNNKISGLPPHKISKMGISLVPEGRELFPRMTVQDNLIMGAYNHKTSENIQDMLDWVYGLFPILKERSRQITGTLSGGEQQMLAIGRALMSKPDLLMLDEPSVGLAPIIARRALETIEKLSDEGVTILLVEQNVYQSLDMADRAYVLEGGRITLKGSGKELLGNPQVKTSYLGL